MTAAATATATATGQERPSVAEVWGLLAAVPDPEIPVISVVDLGIVRDVAWTEEAEPTLVVAITPTYSGCPATSVIGLDIETALRRRGITRLRLETRIAPPWTTDWLTPEGREKLKAYGIAPPVGRAADRVRGLLGEAGPIVCPHCNSSDTELISRFGSTPCKAQHRCRACREPFDYFKCV